MLETKHRDDNVVFLQEIHVCVIWTVCSIQSKTFHFRKLSIFENLPFLKKGSLFKQVNLKLCFNSARLFHASFILLGGRIRT